MPPTAGIPEPYPGTIRSAGLVAAMWLVQVLAAIALRITHVRLQADALVGIAVGSIGLVVAIFILRRHLALRDVVQPSASSLAATAGVLVVPVLLVAPFLFILASVADDGVRSAFPMSDDDLAKFEAMLTAGPWGMFAVAMVGPVFEEMLFRGIILRGLLARMPVPRAVIISALLFGVAHLNIYQLVSALLLGVPLAWLYITFRSVLPGIFLHAAINGLAVGIANVARADLTAAELPAWFLIASLAAFVAGARALWVLARLRQSADDRSS